MRLDFRAISVAGESIPANEAHARSLGLPYVERTTEWKQHPLAVIGAGPSVARHVDELRAWSGDRWAVNNAFKWCQQNAIEATFLTIDAGEWDYGEFRAGDKVLLSTTCSPKLFDAVKACYVRIFDLFKDGIWPMTTSASCALTLGPIMGYRKVVFFGCECSFDSEQTHINESLLGSQLMVVRVGGEDFICSPQLYMQMQGMAQIIRLCPEVYEERSGGLLGAVVRHGDYDVVRVTNDLFDLLELRAA